MSNEEKKRNYLVEGILELGRNWAFSVSLASLGAATFYTEIVNGPEGWNRWIFWACLIASTIWFLLAAFRFDEGLQFHHPTKFVRRISYVLTPLLIASGALLVGMVAQVTDNKHIIAICESAHAEPSSPINQADECKKLFKGRAREKAKMEEKLRAKLGQNHHS